MCKSIFAFLFFSLIISSSFSIQTFLSLDATTYNESLAEKYWNLCMASYCLPSKISEWDLGFVSDLYPGVTEVTVVINSTGNECGFTAYYPAQNEILFVFRGTEMLSIQNWIDDLDFFSIDYPGCSGCTVHQGFYNTYLEIKDIIISSAKSLYAKHSNARKIVTGHSLGGALAVHASIDIVNAFGPIDEFYTYGQPRVGNEQFAQYVNVMVPGDFNSRVTHNRDPVPHLPLINMGFFHIDTEVFYNVDGSFSICKVGEDQSCSDNQLDIDILDHLQYMGKDLVPYMLACNL